MKKSLFLSIFISFLLLNPVYGASWEEIQQRGLLKVAVKDNLRPLGYRNSQGDLQGFEIDLARRIALELFGSENAISFVPVTNQERLQVVADVDVDFAIAGITANTSRRRIVDFTDFYYLDATSIVVKKGKKENVTKIGVLNNSRSINQIRYHLPQATLHPVTSYENALELMESGKIDGFAGDASILSGWTQENPNYELLSTLYGGYPLSIALPKGRQYQTLREQVNQIIRKLHQEGWLREKALYWGLPVD